MDKREFSGRVIACEKKLFRVAYLTLGGYPNCEDAVQEALMKAWEGRAALRDPQYFDTWLIRILINECRNLQRRAASRPTAALPDDFPLPDPPDPALRDALMKLDEKYRAPLILHHLEGYPVRQTASMLRTTDGVVRWRLEKGKQMLRRLLDDGEGLK